MSDKLGDGGAKDGFTMNPRILGRYFRTHVAISLFVVLVLTGAAGAATGILRFSPRNASLDLPGALPTQVPQSRSLIPSPVTTDSNSVAYIYLWHIESGSPDDSDSYEAIPVEVANGLSPQRQLEVVLTHLLKGSTEAQDDSHLVSAFVPQTAGMLQAVKIDGLGKATVSFANLSRILGAPAWTSGQLLRQQLAMTVFQFEEITAIEFQFDGSCEKYTNWLTEGSEGCAQVTRLLWEASQTDGSG